MLVHLSLGRSPWNSLPGITFDFLIGRLSPWCVSVHNESFLMAAEALPILYPPEQ